MTRALLATVVHVLVGQSVPADGPSVYLDEVKPVLAARCYSCHGALKQESGLRLDTAAALLEGGDSGPAIAVGSHADSRIVEAVAGDPEVWRMPPEGEPLTPKQIAALKRWIDQGAKAPDDEQPQADPRRHWAFRIPRSEPLPTVGEHSSIGNPIDRFLAAEHERQGLAPRPPAPKNVLLRRLYLDLIGLPPTPRELQAFLADRSPDAYEKVVDRLLADPRYGERWGRHWMDVWRYSDWYGYRKEVRNSRPHIWRWRDWIVESLNDDKAYDRMIVEMLAGDELAPTDRNVVRATGFLARNWYKFNRNVWLDSTIEHTGKAFLGITINCAKCHSHKYDPISHRDYYRFRAFFEPHDVRADQLPGQPNLELDGLARVFDKNADAATYLFERGNDKMPEKDHPLKPAIPTALGGRSIRIESLPLPPVAYYPGLQPFVQRAAIAESKREVAAAESALAKAKAALADAEKRDDAESGIVLAERKAGVARANLVALEARVAADNARYATPPAANAHELSLVAGKTERAANSAAAALGLLEAERASTLAEAKRKKGDEKTEKTIAEARKAVEAARKVVETARAALETSSPDYSPLGAVYPERSTGRRTALARWIADESNPLTARVAMNHLWLRHFGEPIVPTVFDFGMNGPEPTHRRLLDWLAVEFMNRGWRMKPIHRLIVTSAAYCRDSGRTKGEDSNLAIDPDNHYLWRMNARRMEAEAVRDGALYVAGNLDSTMGGPELDEKAGLTLRRRSLYFRHANEKQMLFLQLFDAASVNECYRRSESIVPQQALAMANSSLTLEQAEALADKLSQASLGDGTSSDSSDGPFIDAAFLCVLGRSPEPSERTECDRFLRRQVELLSAATGLTTFGAGAATPPKDRLRRARRNLVHVLLNHNDFVTIK